MKSKAAEIFTLLVLFISVLGLTDCKKEDEFTTSWEDTSIYSIQTYNSNCSVANDSTEGDMFYKYSLFDKGIDGTYINNVSIKNIDYNVCGFEGKFKYGSGPIMLYGFLLNMDLDENSYYMLSFTQNGGFELYYYDGNSGSSPTKAAMSLIYNLKSSDSTNPINASASNTIKVDTVAENQIDITINGTKVYSITDPENKRGTVGFFQMLNEDQISDYRSSNPMVSLYQLNKLQRY